MKESSTLPVSGQQDRNKLSRVQKRIITPLGRADLELCYQHTVLCQTSLPYRNPGENVYLWRRKQGATLLEVQAGRVFHPDLGAMVQVGIPWGAKPRLILAHLNAEALRRCSPEIDTEDSLSAFVKRIRGFTSGREIRAFKEQLGRLSNATIRLAITQSDCLRQVNTQIITSFDLWLKKGERQRVLWPSTIQLSLDYFQSLQAHAVPLNEADLAALAHSAMALDVYAWLAQRLHRINPARAAFIPWSSLKEQFGVDYSRVDNFKVFFRKTLTQVRARYQTARLELNDEGMTVHNSPPPVSKRFVLNKLKA